MKNILKQFVILSLLILFLIFPYLIFSANADVQPQNIKTELQNLGIDSGYETGGVSETTVSSIVGKVINILLSFLGIIFIVLMIYGGFLWMTDRGNEDQVEKAKKLITNAVIGLIVVVASYAASYFIFSRIVNERLSNPPAASVSEGGGASTHEGE